MNITTGRQKKKKKRLLVSLYYWAMNVALNVGDVECRGWKLLFSAWSSNPFVPSTHTWLIAMDEKLEDYQNTDRVP